MAAVVARLEALPGARHVSITDTGRVGAVVVSADVGAGAADSVLAMLEELGVAADDVVLQRLDTIGRASGGVEPLSLVWADLVGQARLQSRAPARYFVFMLPQV